MHVAARMQRMGTEEAFAVRARATALEARGVDVIHLEMGEPDQPTPPHIVEAAVKALRDGHTGYAPPAGLPALREAIAADVERTRGFPVEPSQVVVCPGAKPVILFTFLALVEAGDEVVLPDPGFPIFASLADSMGAVVRRYDPGCGTLRRPDLDRLASLVTDRTRLLVLNSPGNPTGLVLSPGEIRRVADLCRDRDLWVLSDEIYARIRFGAPHASIAAEEGLAGKTILLDGFSKAYAMTGWRLGYAVAPPPVARMFERLMVNSASCAVTFAQHAALAALAGPQDAVERMVNTFRRRRDALLAGLARLPDVRCDEPSGAFFAFADVRATGQDARALAERLLEEAGVATVAGTAFGPGGQGHLRLSLTASEARIEEAVARLRNLLTP